MMDRLNKKSINYIVTPWVLSGFRIYLYKKGLINADLSCRHYKKGTEELITHEVNNTISNESKKNDEYPTNDQTSTENEKVGL